MKQRKENPITGVAIETRFIGPSNTKGARIKAFTESRSITIPYPHELESGAAHEFAARTLANKMKWTGTLVGGGTKKGYAFVFADGPFGKDDSVKRLMKNPRKRRTGTFTPAMREAFERGGDQTYRGYRITFNAIHSEYYISKDGFHIATCRTISDAKKQIDAILGPINNPRKRRIKLSGERQRRVKGIPPNYNRRKLKRLARRAFGKTARINPASRKTIRVVIKGDKFKVARVMADNGIPFLFVKEAGGNTVGDIPGQHVRKLHDLLERHPEMEGRFARRTNPEPRKSYYCIEESKTGKPGTWHEVASVRTEYEAKTIAKYFAKHRPAMFVRVVKKP